ncbi:MAG: PAS domain S-box protein [Gemmatimonadaceae bacterium]
MSEQALLRIVTENARVGLVVVSPDRHYLYVNTTYAELLDLPTSSLVGHRLEDVLGDVYHAQVKARLDLAFSGERVAYDLLRPTKQGERHLSVKYEPIASNGTIAMVVVVITDVTELRLRQVEASRFAAMVEWSDDAIISGDLGGLIVSWNQGAERLLGYEPNEVIGTPYLRLVPDERQAEELATVAMIRDGQQVPSYETQRRTKDGRLVDVWTATSPIRDTSGAIVGVSRVTRDISERRRADDERQFQQTMLMTERDLTLDGILVVDAQSKVLSYNRRFSEMWGLTQSVLATRADAVLLQAVQDQLRNPDAFMARVRDLYDRHTESSHDEVELTDGRMFERYSAPMRHVDGQYYGRVWYFRDVTERRALEAQYHQAQKMEAVGQLAAGVAHDFNNLLTAILGYCQLLLIDLEASDGRRADVMEIHSAGERAARLTRQLLAFSRKQIIEPVILDVNLLISEMQGMLARLLGEDITVVLQRGRDVSPVCVDRGQAEQIILNLSVNARDAMPNGGTLTIQTADVVLDEASAAAHHMAKTGRYVALSIIDTGVGMSPDVRSHLFEPFFTTKEPGKGTGLGLATVHGIVARMNGAIGVQSELGTGSVFTVLIPCAAEDATVFETLPPSAQSAGAGETILVVDDADGPRVLAKRMLERQGYRILLAANVTEATERLRGHPEIVVMLTDVVMPGGSGPELVQQLSNERPGLRVIYMSGYTEDAITHRGVLDPGIAFLHKPFTWETLGRKIREVLDQR